MADLTRAEYEALPPVLTVEQAAAVLKLSRDQVQRAAKAGTLPATQIGRQWRFSKSRLEQFTRGESSGPMAFAESVAEATAAEPGSADQATFDLVSLLRGQAAEGTAEWLLRDNMDYARQYADLWRRCGEWASRAGER